jgi:hypothetical protein
MSMSYKSISALVMFALLGCDDSGLEQELEFDEAITDLHILIDGGDIQLIATDEGPAHVAADFTHHGGTKPKLDAFVDGSLLRVWVTCGDGCWGMRGQVTVHAPRGVRGMLETGDGEIDVDGAAGELVIESGSGPVSGAGLASPQLTVSTNQGRIDLEFVASPLLADLETGQGDIDLRVPTGAYDIDADAGSGSVHLDALIQDADSPRRLVLDTAVGDIRVSGF